MEPGFLNHYLEDCCPWTGNTHLNFIWETNKLLGFTCVAVNTVLTNRVASNKGKFRDKSYYESARSLLLQKNQGKKQLNKMHFYENSCNT